MAVSGEKYGEEIVGGWGMGHVHTTTFKMGNQQYLLYSTGDNAQCYVAAWIGGEFGEE